MQFKVEKVQIFHMLNAFMSSILNYSRKFLKLLISPTERRKKYDKKGKINKTVSGYNMLILHIFRPASMLDL